VLLVLSEFPSTIRPTLVTVTVSASDVAAVLRSRLSGLPVKKLHKLLYYCQGHHLAAFDEPLFTETISAWDMGPVVGTLWHREKEGKAAPGPTDLSEAQLNTVGYVLSRYGALTGQDLENLTHSEPPWQVANSRRPPGQSVRIEQDWLRAYFRSDGAPEVGDQGDMPLDAGDVTEWLSGAEGRREEHPRPDSPDELRRRLSASA
jgi:uncharacterized phage-associated protein